MERRAYLSVISSVSLGAVLAGCSETEDDSDTATETPEEPDLVITVENKQGEALENTLIELIEKGDSQSSDETVMAGSTDSEGRLTFGDLEEGVTYTLVASHEGYVEEETEAFEFEGDQLEASFSLPKVGETSTETPTETPEETPTETPEETPTDTPEDTNLSDEEIMENFELQLQVFDLNLVDYSISEDELYIHYETDSTSPTEIRNDILNVEVVYYSAILQGLSTDRLVAEISEPNEEPVGRFVIESQWSLAYDNGEITQAELEDRILDTLEILD